MFLTNADNSFVYEVKNREYAEAGRKTIDYLQAIAGRAPAEGPNFPADIAQMELNSIASAARANPALRAEIIAIMAAWLDVEAQGQKASGLVDSRFNTAALFFILDITPKIRPEETETERIARAFNISQDEQPAPEQQPALPRTEQEERVYPQLTQFLLDKVSHTILGGKGSKRVIGGAIDIGNELTGSKKESTVSVSILSTETSPDYSPFDAEDALYYGVIMSLAAAGNSHITPQMIYEQRFPGQQPSKRDIEDIKHRCRKMQRTIGIIDTTKEGFGYKKRILEAPLLPFPIDQQASYKGQPVSFALLAYDPFTADKKKKRPVLHDYAAERRQIAFHTPEALAGPKPHTKARAAALRRMLYLIDLNRPQEGRKLRRSQHQSVELTTILKDLDITRNKNRWLENNLYPVLDHLRDCGEIKSWEIKNDTIFWDAVPRKGSSRGPQNGNPDTGKGDKKRRSNSTTKPKKGGTH